MNNLLLALDFGGTKLSAAVIDRDALQSERPQWLELRREFTPHDADANYELAAMLRLAREMLGGHATAAVGVSFGGPVDFVTGTVRLSHHVAGWEDFPLQARLQETFDAPAVVDNDANVGALGEHRFGAGRGVDDLMYVTVSTGVGGGWVLGGRPWRGHDGMAGEIGHTVVDPNGPLCLCGKRGCVERLASGPYMAADYQEMQGRKGEGEQGRSDDRPWTADHSAPASGGLPANVGLSASGGSSSVVRRPLTGRDVAERAAAGDPLAAEILLRGARALGVGLGNAANLINPQRFILGGGVTKAGEAWWAEVRRAARATALPEVTFDVIPALLGDDAPLWGAVALAEGVQ